MWQIIHHILSQHYHKLFIEYFNKFQQVSTRWMSIDFLLQLIQQHSFTFISTNHDTILYQYFNNILHRQSIFHFSTFLHHIFNKHSTNSYKAFFTTNWWCIISTNIPTNIPTNISTHSSIKSSTTNFMMRIIHFNKCIRKSWYNVRHMLYNLFTTLFTSSSHTSSQQFWYRTLLQQFWYRTSTNTSSQFMINTFVSWYNILIKYMI